MLVVTTNDLPGHRIVRVLGLARGLSVRSRSIVGNVGATFQIFGAPDAGALQTETEGALADVYWGSGTTATKPLLNLGADGGTFYFKVTHASQDATNTGDYYRCGVALTAP